MPWYDSPMTEETGLWLASREDPARRTLAGGPELDRIMELFPRTAGEPAFDPTLIAANAERLRTAPPVDTGHPFLDRSVKIALAHIDATFQGDHPKYGVEYYAQDWCDGFPPTIIAAVDALSAWGMGPRAARFFRYWLLTFVRADGSIDYGYQGVDGSSVSEYGQLLDSAAALEGRAGTEGWWSDGFGSLDRLAEHLLELAAVARRADGLIRGVPEADKREEPGRFFHNGAWAARGLLRWADLCERRGAHPTSSTTAIRGAAGQLASDTLRVLRKTWPADPSDWWLPPQAEPRPRPLGLTDGSLASYTNYRYWPELLSSGLLPADLANRVVEARLCAGGQFCGMTRFEDHLDDWPLAEYLRGLWHLGRRDDFLLSLYGHVAYHQAEGHLTAYEQVTLPPGRKVWPYCLPCQLVVARAARVLCG